MPFYESVFIARQEVSATQVDSIADSFGELIGKHGGQVTKREYWGLKNLAYRIKKNRKGHYVLLNIDAPSAAVQEYERNMRFHEDILRYLTVRMDELEEAPSAMMQGRTRERATRDRHDRDDRPAAQAGGAKADSPKAEDKPAAKGDADAAKADAGKTDSPKAEDKPTAKGDADAAKADAGKADSPKAEDKPAAMGDADAAKAAEADAGTADSPDAEDKPTAKGDAAEKDAAAKEEK